MTQLNLVEGDYTVNTYYPGVIRKMPDGSFRLEFAGESSVIIRIAESADGLNSAVSISNVGSSRSKRRVAVAPSPVFREGG